jgi:hypothetical protein
MSSEIGRSSRVFSLSQAALRAVKTHLWLQARFARTKLADALHRPDQLAGSVSLLLGPAFTLRLSDLLASSSTELTSFAAWNRGLCFTAPAELESKARTLLRRAISSSTAASMLSVVMEQVYSGRDLLHVASEKEALSETECAGTQGICFG